MKVFVKILKTLCFLGWISSAVVEAQFIHSLFQDDTDQDLFNRTMDLQFLEEWKLLAKPVSGPQGIFLSEDPEDVRFYLYTNPLNLDDFHPIQWNNANQLQSLPWIRGVPVKILIHGYTQSQNTSMPAVIKNAYLNRMRDFSTEKVNIIVCDWGALAGNLFETLLPFYSKAVQNVKVTGQRVGELIVNLQKIGITTQSKVHVIGFSLGAHVAGWAGRKVNDMTKIKIDRITALDAAGPLFHYSSESISANDAKFVDSYHTSWGTYGINRPVGHADFYANSPTFPAQIQPYCLNFIKTLLPIAVCSHNMAPIYYAMSIQRNHTACACENYRNYESFCQHFCPNPTTFGELWEKSHNGDFYIEIPNHFYSAQPYRSSAVQESNSLRPRVLSQNAPRMITEVLIGVDITPQTREHVKLVKKLLYNPALYFRGGEVARNETIRAFIPERIIENIYRGMDDAGLHYYRATLQTFKVQTIHRPRTNGI